MSKQQVGIYRLYKLGKLSGTAFDKSIKKLEADLHPVHHDYAEQINRQSELNGLFYEKDEEATDKYWNGEPYRGDAKKAKAKNALGEGSKDAEGKKGTDAKGKTPAPAAEKGKDADLDLVGDAKKAKMDELRTMYLDITKNEAIPTWGIKKLKEQIEIEKAKVA